MNNIEVANLDLGYDQCEKLHTLVVNSGETLLNDLASNINSLKLHWIGSDAANHINNLIKVYEALVALLTDAKAIVAGAANNIIAIQEVRNANGGTGSIGSSLSNVAPASVALTLADVTAEYNVDPIAVSDLSNLQKITENYINLKGLFISYQEELMQNWLAGANREQALSNFNEFATNSEIYKKYLEGARDNLASALGRISGVA